MRNNGMVGLFECNVTNKFIPLQQAIMWLEGCVCNTYMFGLRKCMCNDYREFSKVPDQVT